jgi:hypothetical protein
MRVFIALLCALTLVLPGSALSSEDELKVLVVFNFLKFVDWPASQKQLTLGTLGNDPLGRSLSTINGKKISERALAVKGTKNITEARAVNCLYIGPSKAGDLDKILGAVGKSPVLTVSDIPGFAERGGALGLFRDADHIRFAANLRTVRASGLKVSSRLLSLAKIVDPEGLKGDIIHIVMDKEAFMRAAGN